MSKSKRAAREAQTPAPRERRQLFRSKDGGIRTGWLIAVSLIGYAALLAAGRYGLSRGFAALFAAWNIDGTNAWRAPGWARLLYAWHGSLITIIVSTLTLGLVAWLRRLWRLGQGRLRFSGKALLVPALLGFGGAVLVAALCLVPDSMRPEWPLTAPRLTWSLIPLCVVSLLGTLAEEAFTKRVLYDGLFRRWGRPWAITVACIAFFLVNGGWAGSAVSAINVLLLGALCCLIYEKGGLWACAGLRWGWSVGTVFLLGFGGGDAALYRLYAVSETLLTGGDPGPMYGLWAMLLIIAAIVAIELKRNK